MDQAFRLSDEQIEKIVNRMVPLIAAPEDHEFFRGVLTLKAKESSSCGFAYFCSKLLTVAEETTPEVCHGVG